MRIFELASHFAFGLSVLNGLALVDRVLAFAQGYFDFGASAFEVQAMTGHRTLAMVQRYTKVDQVNAAAAMRKRVQS